MNFSVEEKYNCVVISMKGNVMGGPKAENFRNTLKELIEQGKKEIVVDLGNVKFMNSSGLGILIAGLTTMRNAGGDLKICNAGDKIESLLVVTRLITVFDHYRSQEEAIKAYEE